VGVVFDNLGAFGEGLRTTAALTVLSYLVAFFVGTLVAGMRVSPILPLRWLGTVWTEALRNTPLTVLFFVFFFGFTKIGVSYVPFTSAVIVLGCYTSAFIAETVRSGINSVAPGQAEAARALGLGFPQVLLTIVLPQALRTVVAPLGSLFIALTKNTSIAVTVSVVELTNVVRRLATETGEAIPLYAGVAVAYLLLTLPSSAVIGMIERKVAIRR
jgi:glutamate transport system permease protein